MKHRFQCEGCGRVMDVELAENQLGPAGGCKCGDDDWIPQGLTPGKDEDYHVVWEIDVTASSPVAAAEEALKLVRGHGSTANVFDVFDARGEKTHVDLQQIKETSDG